MCEILVIFNKEDKKTIVSRLQSSIRSNPHGAGIAYFLNDKLYFFKELDGEKVLEFFQDTYRLLEVPIVIHTRFATEGTIDTSNCHPFELSNPMKLRGRATRLLFHNGVISDSVLTLLEIFIPNGKRNKEDSDTRRLAKMLANLKDHSKENRLLSALADLGNRLVILNSNKLVKMYGKFHKLVEGVFTSVPVERYTYYYYYQHYTPGLRNYKLGGDKLDY